MTEYLAVLVDLAVLLEGSDETGAEVLQCGFRGDVWASRWIDGPIEVSQRLLTKGD